MNRPVLFSTLMTLAAIASSATATQAICIGEDDFSLRRSATPDDSFVSSSPARADSTFKLEVDLGTGLDIFDTEDEDAEAEADTATTADTMEAEAEAVSEEPANGTTVADLEAGSSSASDLDIVELEAQPVVSREDYLSSRASEINRCR